MFFHDTPKKVHEIVLLAREGKKLYQQIEKLCRSETMDKQVYVKILKRVKRNRKKIEENPNYQLLRISMTKAELIIRSGQYLKMESINEEGLEIARQGKKFMELLEECAQIIKRYTEETVGRAKLETE